MSSDVILIYPTWNNNLLQNKLFDFSNLELQIRNSIANNQYHRLIDYNERAFMELVKYLNKRKFKCYTIDSVDVNGLKNASKIIFFDLPKQNDVYLNRCLSLGLQEKLFLVIQEPYVVKRINYNFEIHKNFNKILTWMDDLTHGSKRYLKYFFPAPLYFHEKVELSSLPTFSERKFLTMIASNKYSPYSEKQLYTARLELIRYMEKYHSNEFEFYGQYWDIPCIHNKFFHKINIMVRIIMSKLNLGVKMYKTWKGKIKFKADILPHYRFCVCYENQICKGYISEKPIHSFLCGTIPIYYDHINASHWLNKNTYIAFKDFKSFKEFYEYLVSIDKKTFNEYNENIQQFLNSEKFYPFTIDAYIDNFKKLLEID